MTTIKQSLICLTRDDRGFAVSIELALVATILLLGSITGLASVRDAVMSEVSDVAGGMQDLNQKFRYAGIVGHSGSTAGSNFDDALDFCDSAEDLSGQADNCITFDGPPVDENGGGVAMFTAGFEEGIDPNNATRTFGLGPTFAYHFDSEDVPGWGTTDPDGQIEIWESGFAGVDSQDGDYHAEINAGENSRLFQDFAVTPGDVVEYSIWHRGRNGVDVANVLIGPPGMESVDQTLSTGNTDWVNYTGTYTVPAGVTTVRFSFEAVSSANNNPSIGNFIDSFEVNISN